MTSSDNSTEEKDYFQSGDLVVFDYFMYPTGPGFAYIIFGSRIKHLERQFQGKLQAYQIYEALIFGGTDDHANRSPEYHDRLVRKADLSRYKFLARGYP